MPYLMVQTSQRLDEEAKTKLLKQVSARVAEILGKPESYVMVAVEDGVAMSFAGDTAPCVYLELKSIGLPEPRTAELSAALAEQVESGLGVPRNRVYIEFANAERHLWGFNGTTFAR